MDHLSAALARRKLTDAPKSLLPFADLPFDLEVVVFGDAHGETRNRVLATSLR